ncbi:uncharacterized protein LOC126265270 isoform X3 [Aethina tumida]|uniref:uncharacterized protein LOC126265270 isoform X3 n=1 Tax=Aethina tumida TaxID=116153 RepID=UPI00214732A8|nr:uncharacterized protein LOC126265270 isoform X3 [Aethina tumida]
MDVGCETDEDINPNITLEKTMNMVASILGDINSERHKLDYNLHKAKFLEAKFQQELTQLQNKIRYLEQDLENEKRCKEYAQKEVEQLKTYISTNIDPRDSRHLIMLLNRIEDFEQTRIATENKEVMVENDNENRLTRENACLVKSVKELQTCLKSLAERLKNREVRVSELKKDILKIHSGYRQIISNTAEQKILK